jgi:hypothetical protein
VNLVRIAAGLAGASYGVLSAFAGRPDSQDETLHAKLRDELKAAGYSPVEARGEWEGVPELCWVVPGIALDELVAMALRFGQEAIVFCSTGGHPRVFSVGGVPRPPPSIPEES